MESPLIDIRPDHWAIVRDILQKHVPQFEVWAFGSRAKWKAKEYSDLDLAVISDKPLRLSVSASLADDFSESDLSFKVDVVDWATISESFRKIIEQDKVVVQEARPSKKGGMAEARLEHITFSKLIADGALEIGDGYRAKNEELGGAGLIFLRAGHVTDTHIDFAGVERFHTKLEQRVRSKLAKPGDAVITTKGNSTGRTTFVSSSMPPFVYSPHLSYWRSLDPSRIESGFLRYWCRCSEFRTQLAGLKSSTDMAPYLSLVDQKRLEISLPPISEQRAIAHILGTLDDKIELNRRMNETLEAMARALFKSWFVDFDPIRAKAESLDPGLLKPLADLFPDSFEESELGRIPKGWKVRSLDEIARFLNGLALQKYPPKCGRSLPVIKIAQLRAASTTGADTASADLEVDYIVEDGDVLFSWSGSLECVIWTGGQGALNQHLFKATSAEFPKWFYYLWIHQHLADFRHIAAGKATTMGHIQRHHLSDAKVVVPSRDVLKTANHSLSALFERVITTRLESRTLAALRDTLLPKLVTGELRVNDTSRFSATAA